MSGNHDNTPADKPNDPQIQNAQNQVFPDPGIYERRMRRRPSRQPKEQDNQGTPSQESTTAADPAESNEG